MVYFVLSMLKWLKRLVMTVVVVGLGYGAYYQVKTVIQNAANKVNVAQAQTQQTQDTGTELTGNKGYDNDFAKTDYTPKDYLKPTYDPFSNKYNPNPNYDELKDDTYKHQPDIPPVADFDYVTDRYGFQNKDEATAGTTFTFNSSYSTDVETKTENLMSRWDFDGDGVPDTYFSTSKAARHTFDKPGVYNVTLEVMDNGGNVSKVIKPITIVSNTAPVGYFTFTPTHGTLGTVFYFNTEKSFDSQYMSDYLEYRFDFNGDGVWDTKFEKQLSWAHKFSQVGVNHVVMEVRDPEGLSSTAYADVTIIPNTAPVASFTVVPASNSSGFVINQNISFDASNSTDNETVKDKLQYRWDYNYTGADDIVFDTGWSSAPKQYARFSIPGHKVVRLEVKDEDGAVSDAFAELNITGN